MTLSEPLRSRTDLFPSQGRVRRDNDSSERKPKGRIPSHVCRSGPDGRSDLSPRLLVASERLKSPLNAPVPKGTREEYARKIL